MKRTLKKYFIPHRENDNKPHFLRRETAVRVAWVVALIELLFLIPAFVVFPNTNFFAAILPSVLVDGTNEARVEADTAPLRINPLLEEAARRKAADMAEKGYFAHTSPEGVTPWYWLTEVGYSFSAAGENLAVNFVDSEDITEAWLNSSSHRENMLNEGFAEIGIGTARGEYKGKQTVFVVQFFGRPSPVLAASGGVRGSAGSTAPAPPAITEPTEEPFVEIETAEEEVASGETTPADPAVDAGFVKRVLASPHATTTALYAFLGAVVALALLLKIFINIKIQHPPLILNGVLLIIIISSVIAANEYVSNFGAGVT